MNATPSARYASVLRPGLFEGQVIWVTGGGSGIGRCVAYELASLGARVVISGRSLNNAGGQFPAPLQSISKRGFDAVVSNNLTGGFLMAREVFAQSMQEHGGAIVNMTADFRNGMPGMGHSGAARAGMSNLTMSAAVEWAAHGVRVNAVAPGWIASSGMDTYASPCRSMAARRSQARCGLRQSIRTASLSMGSSRGDAGSAEINHPRSAFGAPPQGGATGGPAKPAPRWPLVTCLH